MTGHFKGFLFATVFLFLTALMSFVSFNSFAQNYYKTSDGVVEFVSDAPLETITATSKALRGIVDVEKQTFAFTLNIESLQGFNSPLQKEHFYENYMETDKYPVATFSGKIIDGFSIQQTGPAEIRAKGVLNIHGVKHDRIIKVNLDVQSDLITVRSVFDVELENHNIKIPRIVNQKIAPVINVTIEAVLKPEK